MHLFQDALDSLGHGPPVLVFAVPIPQRFGVFRKHLELLEFGHVFPAAVFENVGNQFRLACQLAFDGGIEFGEDAEVGGQKVAAELADDNVGRVELLQGALLPLLSCRQGWKLRPPYR